MEDVIDFGYSALKVLVDFEEVLDFCNHHRGNVSNVVDLIVVGIFCRNADNFDVVFPIVNHFHGPYRPGFYNNSWSNRNAGEDNNIQGVIVIPEGLWDKAVVSWIMKWAKEHAIEFDQLELFVILVLIAGAFWNLDEDIDNFWSLFSWRNIFDDIHGFWRRSAFIKLSPLVEKCIRQEKEIISVLYPKALR